MSLMRDSPQSCYTSLLYCPADTTCAPHFVGATLNGKKRTAYFDTGFPTGKIRITPLNLNQTTATNSVLCITMADTGCDNYMSLCNNHDGTCA